ncbi:Fungal protein kinase [Microdochium nivale]|nr:Fungal protein kinase [Microdochium nivale]
MTDQWNGIIESFPVGDSLNSFRSTFRSICEHARINCTPDAVDRLEPHDLKSLISFLLLTLCSLPAAYQLRAPSRGFLSIELQRLAVAVVTNDFDLSRLTPLLKAAVADEPDDSEIWKGASEAVTEYTPPPRSIASALKQTQWLRNTSSLANSSEYRRDMDMMLKQELRHLYVGIHRLPEVFFGRISGLHDASQRVFIKCKEGSEPLFCEGWRGWPKEAKQDSVLEWFSSISQKLAVFAMEILPALIQGRRLLAQPNQPISGSKADRKLDAGFVDDPRVGNGSRLHWSQVLIPGELKSNPLADTWSETWLDLGRYAREVLAAQDTRRFVLGFTLCGSFMRVWEFDRLGGIASDKFDINEDGLRFVFTVLGFLCMDREALGFDPTITTEGNQRFISVTRNGQPERLVIDKLMKRVPCIAGRATTCWSVHREGERQTSFVVKDSWQYTEREEEGELLKKATEEGVVNVADYYHHETVYVCGQVDDISSNIRGNLNIREAKKYRLIQPGSSSATSISREGRSNVAAGKKRSFSQSSAPTPSNEYRSASPAHAGSPALPNRVHRRVVVGDCGMPIYKAKSPSVLLSALSDCIEGHKSLRQKADLLHRDISVNNLMIRGEKGFLIDLDLAVTEHREAASGAHGITGTRAFMAIGVLAGERHSFMHDLESFFWVLFWICIHHNGPEESSRVVPSFEKWNYLGTNELKRMKLGTVADDEFFMGTMMKNFTDHFKALIPAVDRLRRVVFPGGGRWKKENDDLYSSMQNILLRPESTLKSQMIDKYSMQCKK